MVANLTPTKICIKLDSLNPIEENFLDEYQAPECLTCHYKNDSYEITGKPENLYEVLLMLSYKFDIEIV